MRREVREVRQRDSGTAVAREDNWIVYLDCAVRIIFIDNRVI